jgi:VWFA-related protein
MKKTRLSSFMRTTALAASLCVALPIPAQQQEAPAEIPTPAIQISTHFVAVNVVATDKSGNPVTGLKKEDFTLEESGKKQSIATFETTSPQTSGPGQLPPNVYTNRPEYTMPNGPLNILLLDALNTPVRNQSYARQALISWAAYQLQKGQKAAVFGLGTRLTKIQDFTSDPEVLRKAIESFKPQTTAATPGGASGPVVDVSASNEGAGRDSGSGAGGQLTATALLQAKAAVASFQQDQTPTMLTARIEHTIEALTALARIAGGHPGRKNIIWLTASVPFTFNPDTSTVDSMFAQRVEQPVGYTPMPDEIHNTELNNPMQEYGAQVQRLSAMLSSVQASVYPIDVRGLFVGGSTADATVNSGLVTDFDYAAEVANANNATIKQQDRMEEIAAETGGRAFFNRNDIENAVAYAAKDGESSYDLGYYPLNKRYDGNYRRLKISVNRPGVVLRYRDGYFAIDPGAKKNNKEAEVAMTQALTAASPSTMVIFDARVVPPAPAASMTVPITLLIHSDSFSAEEVGGGKHHISLDCFAAAYGGNGQMVKNTGKAINTDIDQSQYEQMMKQGLMLGMELPLSAGKYDIRLAVRDNRTGFIGTVSAPLNLTKP